MNILGSVFLFSWPIYIRIGIFFLNVWWNSPEKPFRSVFFFVGRFLITTLISLIDIRLFRLSISFWVSFYSLCFSRNFSEVGHIHCKNYLWLSLTIFLIPVRFLVISPLSFLNISSLFLMSFCWGVWLEIYQFYFFNELVFDFIDILLVSPCSGRDYCSDLFWSFFAFNLLFF